MKCALYKNPPLLLLLLLLITFSDIPLLLLSAEQQIPQPKPSMLGRLNDPQTQAASSDAGYPLLSAASALRAAV